MMQVHDYYTWIKHHRKYSKNPEFNLDRAGYIYVSECAPDVVECGNGNERWENNRELCEGLANIYKFDDWVCIRRMGAFGVPFIVIYAK